MMEYWNVGMLGIVGWGLFYNDGTDQFIKSDLIRFRFPIFHYSIIPLFHWDSKVNPTPLG